MKTRPVIVPAKSAGATGKPAGPVDMDDDDDDDEDEDE